jgi:hypothetical protein
LRTGVQHQVRKKRSAPANRLACRMISLEIASVSFSIIYPDSFILQDYGPSYKTFLKAVQYSPADIDIVLKLNNIPDTGAMKIIFDSGQAWSMFQKDDTFYLKFMSPESKEPFWVTEISSDFARATVHCSEKFIQDSNGTKTLPNPVCYPLDQILLMYFLAQRQGALIHAAGIEYNGKGFIFPGRSGAGKTTISGQLACSDRLKKLSDDRIVARKMHNTFQAFGTPWHGEGGIAINRRVPLSGMFFISHAEYNRIEEIKPQKALEMLLPVTSIPWYDPEVMDKVLHFCDDLTSGIPAYNLSFKPGTEIGDIFEKFISA